MPGILEQEKELRFTRSAQSVAFWLLAAVSGMTALTLVVASSSRGENPALPHPLWALLPALIAALAARAAIHMTRHAYLILTPLGIDVFPLFRPSKGMRTVFWSEIHAVDVDLDRCRVALHFNKEKTSGIFLSLKPIVKHNRDLLIKALDGRIAKDPR